ncbi:TPR-like protein [Fomitiporia mediterranea MF3/22]|uniref:TPR-like protein n=1 Tax=Fomitiporia mediterranea (strain MF3/22) TaxID=694068 RepID=UPI00044097B4|nr:TPR-like protein [Fomitiporia mediterranea MF3/22]EJD00714.1 TPR-like protein [Fomitiporia mediterranea MF3/22]
MKLLPSCLTFLVLSLVAAAQAQAEQQHLAPELQPLINKANAYLTSGQFNDAVKAYSEAIEQSPTDYILYYKRATAYYSLSRHPNALADFDKVLELTGGSFDKALLMQGRIHAQEGSWSAARDALKRYSSRVKNDASAGDLMFEVTEGEAAEKKATQSKRSGNYQECVAAATEALRIASHSGDLRELRADCALSSSDVQQAVGDLVRLTHLRPASSALFLRVAQLAYFLLPPSPQAASALKQCLHFDPDSAKCAKMHKKLKKFDKDFEKLNALREANDWRGLVTHLFGSNAKETPPGSGFAAQFDAEVAKVEVPSNITPLRTSERRKDVVRALCVAYVRLEQPKRSEWWCEELLRFEGNAEDIDGLVGRAEMMMVNEKWEEAVRTFEKAFELSGRSNQDIMKRLQKAQRLLKQSRQKDYYKVLGVPRDADERTIKKAYRKAAKTAHPDKGGSEDKMAAVNEAYEVLSNPELRTRFDNGDDPNDTSNQGSPFQQGGHPFAQFFQGGPGGFGGGKHGGFQFQQGGGMPFSFHFSSGGRH